MSKAKSIQEKIIDILISEQQDAKIGADGVYEQIVCVTSESYSGVAKKLIELFQSQIVLPKEIEILKQIYKSEINCRIEWLWDSGFTWSIQNNDYPRLLKDEKLKSCAKSEEIVLLENNPLLEKDWIARGNKPAIEECIQELAESICKYLPESEFAKWLRDKTQTQLK